MARLRRASGLEKALEKARSKRVKFWKARKKAAGIGERPAAKGQKGEKGSKVEKGGKRERLDDGGIRTHAPCETRT